MFKKLLVPVDISEPELAKPALKAAIGMARGGAKIHLFNVVPSMPVMAAEYVPVDFEEQQRQTAIERLTQFGKAAGLSPDQLTVGVRQGGIYHEIIEEAASIGADLIIMSSHRPAMRTYFLGSNAAHVVRYARCSVLVVRT